MIDNIPNFLFEQKVKTVAVCFPQHPFMSGGAEILAHSLTSQLKEFGFEAELITMPYKWAPPEQILECVNAWSMFDLNRFGNKKIDLLITTKFPSYFVKHDNKVLWLVHQLRQMHDLYDTSFSCFNSFNKNHQKIKFELIKKENEAFKNHKKIFSISKNVSKRLKTYSGFDSDVLYHPPMLFDKLDHQEKCNNNYILSVGRLTSLKRIDFLIHAISKCKSNVRCLIAGVGSEKENLENLCHHLKIKRKVDFLGKVSENKLLELYASCTAVYFAPYDEDYGYITLEAFFTKKPVLTTADAGGVLEFVDNNVNGFVVQPKDIDSLSIKIDTLINNPELGRKMGEAGHQIVNWMNWRSVIEKLTNF